ncbi:MAG: hypothetical protein FGM55_01070 [Rhodoferax sp.]|nr:hypothetical protein [Rhodoferax sp.]
MKLYLDSADAQAWRLPAGCPPVQGVTTNPTLVRQAGLPVSLPAYLGLLQAVADQGLPELMLQLPSADPAQASDWAQTLREQAQRLQLGLTLKLPCHPDWSPAIVAVQQCGLPVLLTGLSNPVQLLWARSLGAAYVAPYIGRLAADGRDVWSFMQACVAVQAAGPALLAASIKSADVLTRLIACGAAAATLPPANLVVWASDRLTDAAIEQFERDSRDSLG